MKKDVHQERFMNMTVCADWMNFIRGKKKKIGKMDDHLCLNNKNSPLGANRTLKYVVLRSSVLSGEFLGLKIVGLKSGVLDQDYFQ